MWYLIVSIPDLCTLTNFADKVTQYHLTFLKCADILGKIIRNNNDIREIIIDNKKYKISQYADDTQLF